VVHDLDGLINTDKSINNEEVCALYKTIPGEWVLLEPVEWNKNKKATRLKILTYGKDKEVIRNEVMENDEWLNLGSLIYFFTGYDGTCKI